MVADDATWAIIDSLEEENWGRPIALVDLKTLAAQVSGFEMYRLCFDIRKVDRLCKAAGEYILWGATPGDHRNIFKHMMGLIDKFGLGFDASPKTGKGFQLWINSPMRLKRWVESAAPDRGASGSQFALSNQAFERLTSGGVEFENLAKQISAAKVLALYQSVFDLEYTRTLKGRYWKWMMGDLYPADQDAELKKRFGLKLNRWRRQSGDTIVFDVADSDQLRAWIAHDDSNGAIV